MADASPRLVPNCKVLVDGSPLDPPVQASLVRLSVDLDADLFAQTTLLFADPAMKLMSGDTFACGAALKVKLGYGANLETLFDGEVVRLEPQFRKDEPIALSVVCQEPLHRLALSQSTRSLNDVDVAGVVSQIAQEHGFSSEAPSGTKQNAIQANISNATMLRRMGSRLGLRVRVEGKKIIMSAPPSTQSIPLLMQDGIRKVKVKMKAAGQVSQVSVHGWDQKNKQEIVGTAKPPSGDVGSGGTSYGDGDSLDDASGDQLPPDQSTAEAMAKGRIQKISEGFIKSQTDMIGDARMVPGQTVDFDKMGPGIDGTWRIERALHDFSRRGYFVKMEAVRISAKKPAPPAPPVKKQDDTDDKDGQLIRPRWKRVAGTNGAQDTATMAVDASATLEGKSVKFILETKVNGDWKQVADGQGSVSSGTATTTANLDPLPTGDLSAPVWTAAKNSSHTHGDSGEVSISSTSKDGVEVRVILEQQNGRGWDMVQQKIAPVKSGAVKASFTLEHPFAAEAGKPNAILLKVPTWTNHPTTHGSTGSVQVRAPGLPDGRMVQFDVERQGADGKWTLVRSVQGKVDRGTATASLPDMRHPANNVQPDHSDVLKNPLWDKTDISHGTAGKFSVEAPDLDGRMVAFILERNDPSGWTQLVKTMAKVSGGKAEASASLAHPAALTAKAPAASSTKASLTNPRWNKKKIAHGEEVDAQIDAVGLDGKTIEFVAERKEVGGWSEVGKATGVVQGGKASGKILIQHPLTDHPGDPKPADPTAKKPKLSNPRWESGSFGDGDTATATIDAVGLEGATIQFAAERLEVGGWVDAGRAIGTVAGGKASGAITVSHPSTDSSARKFRFRSSVLSNPNDKALAVPLVAKYDAKTGKVTASTVGDHDGRTVRFILEQRKITGWATVATAIGKASKGEASGKLPATPAQAGKISAPRWGANKLSHNDIAELVVDAKGLDGQKIKFTVERQVGSTWTGVGVAVATVVAGKATGKVQVAHPAASETTEQEMSKLRFSAALADQKETRVRAELLPDLAPRALRFRARVVDPAQLTGGFDGDSNELRPTKKGATGGGNTTDDSVTVTPTFDLKTGAASASVAGAYEGRMVKFILEEMKTTGWATLSSVTGRVAKGTVSVKLPVHHKANAVLANPRWASKSLLHGDQAQIVVDAKGLNGHRVKFTIERLDNGAWSEVGNTLASVVGNSAKGSITVQHPQGAQVSLAKLRFRCKLADAPQMRVRAEMLPDIDPRQVRFRAELVPDYTKQKLRFAAKPVPDLLPKKMRFRGELPVPLDPALTRMRVSVVGGGAPDVQTGGPVPNT